MASRANLLTAILIFGSGFVTAKATQNIYSSIRTCDIPNLNEISRADCVKVTVEHVRDAMATGRSFLGMPRMEPLFLEEFVFSQNDNRVSLNATFYDLLVHGISKFQVTKAESLYDTLAFKVDLTINQLSIEGRYNLKGIILLLRLAGQGDVALDINDMVISLHIFNKVVKEGGEYKMRVKDMLVEFSTGKLNIALTNLDVGDPVLEETIHHFINTNSQLILENIYPQMKKKFGEIITVYFDIAYNNIDPQLIYPDEVQKLALAA